MISRGETEHACADGARSGQEGVENPGRRSQSPRLSSRRVVDRKIEQEEEEDAWFKSQVLTQISVNFTSGFKNKTECITICMSGSSFIHIETL